MRDPYFNQPGISNSALGQFKRSPKHYLHSKQNPMRATADMSLGSLIHCLAFEPSNFNKYFLLMDENQKPFPAADFRNAKNKEWKEGLLERADNEDLILVDRNMWDRGRKAKEALFNDKTAGELLLYKGNIFESAVAWTKNKSQCKGKIDFRNDYYLGDLKTTKDADPYDFHRLIFQRDIHRQLAMYLDGDAEGTFSVKDLKEAYVIALENDEPFGVSVHRLTPEVLVDGYREYVDLLDQFQTCLDTGVWQGYEFKSGVDSNGIFNVNLPKWKQE